MKTWETFTMSRKEVPRAGLLKAARSGKISNAQGAGALHLSVRQFQRLKVRFVAEGPRGLLHRLRGRPAPRRLPADVRAAVAALLQSTYAGFNDCHATEKLREIEGLVLRWAASCNSTPAPSRGSKPAAPSSCQRQSKYPHRR